MGYHVPVMVREVTDGLVVDPDGTYMDATAGGGGHSEALLHALGKQGHLIAVDRDWEAVEASQARLSTDARAVVWQGSFAELSGLLAEQGGGALSGVLFDLGVSSHQFDVAERGFSFRFDSELDMRMNNSSSLSGRKVVNEYSKEDLANLFFKYGEIRISRKVAELIVLAREEKEIVTTTELLEILDGVVPDKRRNQFLSQVFQSIRIEVNQEIESLKQMLIDGVELLNIGGRFVVLSYHSLEDRLVKRFIQNGTFESDAISDIYGNKDLIFKKIGKLISPDKEEVESNNRSRSAKLRVARKI